MSAETRETPEAPTTFRLEARDGAARAGRLVTPHGSVATPTFMCVATYGAVRGVDPDDLAGIGAQILLANTYHLHERPGEDIVRSQGGLHGFTGWRGPWLTDSGGYQVSSLADRVEIAEEGVTFSSPLDGRRRLLTPESVVAIQEALGSDIAMVLDECHVPVSSSRGRTRRDAPAHRGGDGSLPALGGARAAGPGAGARTALFGIVQGGVDAGLRRRSARGDRCHRVRRLRPRRTRPGGGARASEPTWWRPRTRRSRPTPRAT